MRLSRHLAILFILVLTSCASSIGPSSAELENKLKIGLPSVWTMAGFKVTAEENAGTQTKPNIRARFVAKLVLARDIYKVEEHLLGRLVLTKVKSPGELEVELHGIATSHQSGGSWDVGFEMENIHSTDLPGKPLSDYNDYVIAGSPEEKALRGEAVAREENERNAREQAERLAQEKAQALNQATAALFPADAKLLSRWSNSRTQKAGVFTFVVRKHDPATRTFSGAFVSNDGDSDTVTGSYDGQKVNIVQDNGKCTANLIATGAAPSLRGTFSGPLLGGCGEGGTVEIGLQ